jgi:hypothetical protein
MVEKWRRNGGCREKRSDVVGRPGTYHGIDEILVGTDEIILGGLLKTTRCPGTPRVIPCECVWRCQLQTSRGSIMALQHGQDCLGRHALGATRNQEINPSPVFVSENSLSNT